MTNEEALDIMERQLECDNDNCPELRTSCSECPYNVDAIDYARARKMAIEALSKQCASSEQANDTDRTTGDQCSDGVKMIDLKKRTITERLIIANSLIASAIADSDSNQFREDTKKTDDVPDTNVGDMISRRAAINIERNATVDTNPSHFEAHQKFTQFMDDAEISSFGRWQWSNGFNTALTAVGVDLKRLPSAQPERCEDCENFRKTRLLIPQPDNHEVACLLAELFDDTCACNFNGIDEWLPDKCEFLDACPDPGGVTCWEQFLKHRAERKNDG